MSMLSALFQSMSQLQRYNDLSLATEATGGVYPSLVLTLTSPQLALWQVAEMANKYVCPTLSSPHYYSIVLSSHKITHPPHPPAKLPHSNTITAATTTTWQTPFPSMRPQRAGWDTGVSALTTTQPFHRAAARGRLSSGRCRGVVTVACRR